MGVLKLKTKLLLLVFWVAALLPDSSSAQNTKSQTKPPEAVEDACLSDSKCNELYENARTLSDASQYEGALVTYQSAYARRPVLWLLINIGRMQQKAARPQQAITTYKRFLSDPAADKDAQLQSKAREYLQQAEREVEAQKAALVVLAAPAGPPVAPVVAPTAPGPKNPVYKKWWLWTVVGVAVAGAAVGLGIGLAAARPDVSDATAVRPFGS